MSRPLRLEAPHTYYHVLSRGNERRERNVNNQRLTPFLFSVKTQGLQSLFPPIELGPFGTPKLHHLYTSCVPH